MGHAAEANITPGKSLPENTSGRSIAPVARMTCPARTRIRIRGRCSGLSARWSVTRSARVRYYGPHSRTGWSRQNSHIFHRLQLGRYCADRVLCVLAINLNIICTVQPAAKPVPSSQISTRLPLLAASCAAINPQAPPPTTTISKCALRFSYLSDHYGLCRLCPNLRHVG